MKYYIDKEGKYRGEYTRLDLVEKYELIEVPFPPSSDLLIPIWNGLEWAEGITEQEFQIIKQQKIEELNKLQYNEMEPYDWYFIRLFRKGTAVPQEILDIITEIELRYNNLKNGI
jgi:hypothetical protein